ncbi:hypothetical protein Tco_0958592 [Tanacetum coccineum]
MALSIANQIALDDALVAPTDRLKIGKCNLRLSSDITSKEATLQFFVYLKLEFLWGMYNKKSVVDYAFLLWEDFIFKIETKKVRRGQLRFVLSCGSPNSSCNYVMGKDPSIREETRMKSSVVRGFLPVALTQRGHPQIRILQRVLRYWTLQNNSSLDKKKHEWKANTDAITNRSFQLPQETEDRNRKQKTSEMENISEAMKELGVTTGVPDAPEYDFRGKKEEDDKHGRLMRHESEKMMMLDTDEVDYSISSSDETPRDGEDDDEEEEHSAWNRTGGPKSQDLSLKRFLLANPAPVGEKLLQLQMSLKDLQTIEFETGIQDEQEEEEVQHFPDWFQQPTRLPSPDHAWNKTVPAIQETVQPWLSNLAQQTPRESFDELKRFYILTSTPFVLKPD